MTQDVLILADDADWFCGRLSTACPAFRFHAARTLEQALDNAENTEILIGFAAQLSDSLIAAMPELKWVHALTAGVDNLIHSPALGRAVFLSNSSGIQGPQMSELAILVMLSSLRNFPRILENQRARKWMPWPQPLLRGRTACIVGLGAVAEDLSLRLQALGMTLTAVSDGRRQAPGFVRIFPRSELAVAAAEADFVVVLVPYTKATRHIIDDRVIGSMRSDAILINLSRGECVDEVALGRHLRDGTIRAAALDVFADEPLPPDSPLWHTPNLTITPHVGGRSDVYREQVLPLVVENLKAWSRGGGNALPNLVTSRAIQ